MIKDLRGKHVGSPEWTHSVAVWLRGWMQNDRGIDLTDINWAQAGADAPGRGKKVELNLPEGIDPERIKDKSLSQLLAGSETDCAIVARPPTCFLVNRLDIVRLFPEYIKMEEAYFKETGAWPIVYIVAMKRSIYDEHPWVARNLYNVLLESKDQGVSRLLDPAISRYPLPWVATYANHMRKFMNGDPFPYDIEENRKTWKQMALYSYRQDIAHRQFTPEVIFPPTVSTKVIT